MGGAGKWVFDADEVWVMKRLLFSIAATFALVSCSEGTLKGELTKTDHQFELTSNSTNGQTFVIEKKSGCLWLVIADWTSVKPGPGEKRGSVEFDKNFAKGLDQYALVPVRTANQKFCETEFGLGIDHLKEVGSETPQ